ncbi:phage tail tape measure protein, TP901 family, core region, partial [Escherichia coli 8.2524]
RTARSLRRCVSRR